MFYILSWIMIAAAFASTSAIEVHGHRGARARFPENTLPAFEYAVKSGVNYLEMDMAVTKDGVIVISHDPHISPIICLDPQGKPIEGPEGPLIHSLTLKELKQYDCGTIRNPRFPTQQPVPGTRIPTLDEVFTMVEKSRDPNAKRVKFNIETKIFPDHPEYTVGVEEFVKKFLDIVNRHHMLPRVILQSFDYRTLVEGKKVNPKLVTVALSEDPKEDLVASMKKIGANVMSPDHQIINPEIVSRLHELGVTVVPWTVNDPADWQKLLDMKVDGIISDDPLALITFLKSKGLRQ